MADVAISLDEGMRVTETGNLRIVEGARREREDRGRRQEAGSRDVAEQLC